VRQEPPAHCALHVAPCGQTKMQLPPPQPKVQLALPSQVWVQRPPPQEVAQVEPASQRSAEPLPLKTHVCPALQVQVPLQV